MPTRGLSATFWFRDVLMACRACAFLLFCHFDMLAFRPFGCLAFWHVNILAGWAFWHLTFLFFLHFDMLAFLALWHFGILTVMHVYIFGMSIWWHFDILAFWDVCIFAFLVFRYLALLYTSHPRAYLIWGRRQRRQPLDLVFWMFEGCFKDVLLMTTAIRFYALLQDHTLPTSGSGPRSFDV